MTLRVVSMVAFMVAITYGDPKPTFSPTPSPSTNPTLTREPTVSPVTSDPTLPPSNVPTWNPSYDPTNDPSNSPITLDPSNAPTRAPSINPSNSPSFNPSIQPTSPPVTAPPSKSPSHHPSVVPSKQPTQSPVTHAPTKAPVTPEPTTPLFVEITPAPVYTKPAESPDTESAESRPEDFAKIGSVSIDVMALVFIGIVLLLCVGIAFVIGLWCGEYRDHQKRSNVNIETVQRNMDKMEEEPPNTTQPHVSHENVPNLHNRLASVSESDHDIIPPPPPLDIPPPPPITDPKVMAKEKATVKKKADANNNLVPKEKPVVNDAEPERKTMDEGHKHKQETTRGVVNVQKMMAGSMQKTIGQKQDTGEEMNDGGIVETDDSSSDHSNDSLWDNSQNPAPLPTPGYTERGTATATEN